MGNGEDEVYQVSRKFPSRYTFVFRLHQPIEVHIHTQWNFRCITIAKAKTWGIMKSCNSSFFPSLCDFTVIIKSLIQGIRNLGRVSDVPDLDNCILFPIL
jgi:hypothetical protein